MRPTYLALLSRSLLLFLSIAIGACDTSTEVEATAVPDGYAGTDSCAACHSTETALWRNSHHDLAMQVASLETALGDFNGSQFDHNGVTSRFFSTDGELFVETDGSDGQLATFPVRYTFGVYPLQQYLVELPDEKIQALSIAWDSRSADDGGQHWLHVYGDEFIDHNDVLHWTRPSQNWDTMCADCHSTGLVSRYSLPDDHFDTRWAELNVACEACHGPGAKHVAWANADSSNPDDEKLQDDNGLDLHFNERQNITWLLDSDTGNSTRSTPRTSNIELNACAGCHSRRARLADDVHPATPFLDAYSPALIESPLYHRDGQILDEVYVYGSFLQSRMHQAGVSCSDCHDPHSLELRAPGPAVCLQCHASNKFATVEHQLHESGVTNCIDCHMPATTYMQVDPRNDHSFRIPRPDLSVTYGVPNACNNCHSDKDADWSVAALRNNSQLKIADKPHWSELLASANRGDLASMEALTQLAVDPSVPVIIRASAASRLRLGDAPAARLLINTLGRDPEALIRWATARSLQNSHPQLTAELGPKLLRDPIRSVRITAASTLASIDPVLLSAVTYTDLQAGFAEYIASQMVNAERPESHVNIANLQRVQGRFELAEQEYLTAISLNPSFVPAYVNLADLYREWNREQAAEAVLRNGLGVQANQVDLQHSLGLSLIRQQRLPEALIELEHAALSPDATPRFALVYAVALNSQGRTREAIQFLETALQRFVDDPALVNAFSEFSKQL
jgi:predicted CXXCH cytochrome family protein